MSTLKAINVQHPSAASPNMVTDANGNITIAGTAVMGSGYTFRNRIINGNFDFWQRQTSNTNVVTGQYVADRWINVKFGTPTLNISRQAFTAGQTAVPQEPQFFYRANTVSSTGTANGIYVSQRVESVTTLAGQTATLSFYAKADDSRNIAIEFAQNFGTNGSAEANGINVTTFSLTSSWQKFNTTITLPSISGKTVDSANANYLAVNFWLDAGSTYNSRTNTLGQQSGTFDISKVQLESGSAATPFEIRPIGTELALCQRYFVNWVGDSSAVGYRAIGSGYANQTTTDATIVIPFSVAMRATPTLSFSGTISILDGSASGTLSSIQAAYSSSPSTMWGIFRTGGTFTTGRGAVMYTQNANTNYFAATAEL